jgi:voltage-gated potassium channel
MLWYKIAEYLRRYLGLFLNRRVILSFLSLMAVALGLSSGAILLLERNTPGGLRNPADVFWWVTLTLLDVTDPDFFPATVGGRFIGLFLTSLSTVLLWLFSAIVVTIVLDVVLKEGQGMGRTKHKNHVIICGWNETAEEIIEQLHSADPTKPVVVLAELEMKPVNYTWVDFVRGDPSDSRDLGRANVMEADVAIIFTAMGGGAADAQSLLTALAIETLNRDVYTCVEVLDPKNRQHFIRANVDEMFVRGELGAHLLARSTLCKGLSAIVSELLRWDEGNEFYKIDLEDYYPSMVGKTFDEVLDYLRRSFNLILLGVERTIEREEVIIDPGEELVLLKGDTAIVVPCHGTGDRKPSAIISELLHDNGGEIPDENLRSLEEYITKGGKTLDEIATDLEDKYQQCLLAIRRVAQRIETFVNPKGKLELQAGDQCFVIAWDPPEKQK